jgi:hypothetical protein
VFFQDSPERRISRLPNEPDRDFLSRREAAHQAATRLQANKCLSALMSTWPFPNITFPQTPDVNTYLPGLDLVKDDLRLMFEDWFKNSKFQAYIADLQRLLNQLPWPLPVTSGHYTIPTQIDH